MHILFFNPQGNFNEGDAHMTEHPDFGGQLIYVKEVAMAMVNAGHRVDIVTRRIIDPRAMRIAFVSCACRAAVMTSWRKSSSGNTWRNSLTRR